MSRLIAAFIYRWRFPLSALCVLGAILSVPSANITKIDNDITAWFSRSDPVYRDYERFRQEFAGTRTLIVALKAPTPEQLFSTETLAFIEQVSGEVLQLNEGTVYTSLLRLQQQGWISSDWGVSENNRKARFYSITRAGRKQLARETENWARISGVIGRVLSLAPEK
jgi:transcriptional regulator